MDCHSLATSPIELLDALTLIAFLEDPKLIDGISELLDRSPSPQPNTKDQEVHKDEEAEAKAPGQPPTNLATFGELARAADVRYTHR